MNYADTVERVMALLKERKVCSSSRKSHRDCYESLGLYLTRNNTEYTAKSHDEWFIEIKKKLPSQRCLIWIWYAYQLEEMDSSGTLSDRSLYLNQQQIYDEVSQILKVRENVRIEWHQKHAAERQIYKEMSYKICRQYETLMKIKKMVNAVERRLMYLQGALDRSRMLA